MCAEAFWLVSIIAEDQKALRATKPGTHREAYGDCRKRRNIGRHSTEYFQNVCERGDSDHWPQRTSGGRQGRRMGRASGTAQQSLIKAGETGSGHSVCVCTECMCKVSWRSVLVLAA